MTIAITNLYTTKAVFDAHRKDCPSCERFVPHQTKTLSYLCLKGTQLYKEFLKAEDVIVRMDRAAERAKETRAMRRENIKQLEAQK